MKTGSIETISGGDLPMATAVAQGEQWSFRLGAVRLGDRVYRLIFAAHSLTPAVDARFLRRHPLLPSPEAGGSGRGARAALADRRGARRATARQTLARRMPFEDSALAQFLVLNGFEREEPLTPDRRYKIVAP